MHHDFDSLNDVVIDDIETELEPTSAMLYLCKQRFLRPFVHLLGMVGLRPMSVEASDCSFWLGHLQTLLVLATLLFGYALQFVASFRRDRGLWRGPPAAYASVELNGTAIEAEVGGSPMHLGETLFVYAVPAVLHLCGFAYALYALRVGDNEHLQNLVERVFIQCADRRLAVRMVAALWTYVAIAMLWLAVMTGAIVWPELMATATTTKVVDVYGSQRQTMLVMRLVGFEHPTRDALVAVRWSLLVVVGVHDFVQVVVVTMYAIQCHLLGGHLAYLREKLLQNTLDPIDWMRVSGEGKGI